MSQKDRLRIALAKAGREGLSGAELAATGHWRFGGSISELRRDGWVIDTVPPKGRNCKYYLRGKQPSKAKVTRVETLPEDLSQHDRASDEIFVEVLRAKKLHGADFRSIHEGYAVLQEEVDELWDEVKFNPKKGLDEPTRIEAACRAHKMRMRREAIQVAAMALRFAAELT